MGRLDVLQVKPAQHPNGGLFRILDPHHNYAPIPPEGATVPNTAYFQKRVQEGGLVIVSPEVPPEVPAPSPPSQKKQNSSPGENS